MAEGIDLKEVVKIIERGDWCKIKFITADVIKGTGGKVITIPKCRLCKTRMDELKEKKLEAQAPLQGKDAITRYPNHPLNFTRNMELQNRQIRKVHPVLIFEINDHPVL